MVNGGYLIRSGATLRKLRSALRGAYLARSAALELAAAPVLDEVAGDAVRVAERVAAIGESQKRRAVVTVVGPAVEQRSHEVTRQPGIAGKLGYPRIVELYPAMLDEFGPMVAEECDEQHGEGCLRPVIALAPDHRWNVEHRHQSGPAPSFKHMPRHGLHLVNVVG